MKLSLVKKHDPRSLVSETGAAVKPSGIREFFDIVYSTPDCISLGVGEPDFDTPWGFSDNAIYAIKEGSTHYTPNRGLPELLEMISQYLESHYGLQYSADSELLVTLGVSQGLDLALRSIINPGDEVIIFEPCYVSYTSNVEMLHGKPVVLQLRHERGFAIDVDELAKAITPKTKAILLNYPSNPTGATISEKTLKEIAKLAVENNIIVISDEIYAALTYSSNHQSIVTLPGMKERTIYLNGLSKSHAMTGWRVGFIGGPEFLVGTMLKIHQYTALCASSMGQYAALEALRSGDRDVNRMKKEYLRRKNFLVSRFNEIGLPCHDPEGAIYVFPDISPAGMSSRDFALGLLEKEKVAVVPGLAFGESGKSNVRCSYATSMGNLKEAMIRIERYVRSLHGTSD